MVQKMSTECECQTVKKYDGVYQCMLCRRRFAPLDMIATGLEKREAQVFIVDNMLTIMMSLSEVEIHEIKDEDGADD